MRSSFLPRESARTAKIVGQPQLTPSCGPWRAASPVTS